MVDGVTQEVEELEIIRDDEAQSTPSDPTAVREELGDDEGPIIRLVNSMIMQAIKERASDLASSTSSSINNIWAIANDPLYSPLRSLR